MRPAQVRREYASSEFTRLKNEHHAEILAALAGASAAVMRNHAWAARCYRYIDLTAGPGVVDGVPQSPLLALDVLTAATACEPRLPAFRADFCEVNEGRHATLAAALEACPVPPPSAAASHHRNGIETLADFVAGLPRGTLGAVYYDPVPSKDMFCELADIAELTRVDACRCVDIILYLSATTIKRLHYGNVPGCSLNLQEILDLFEKKTWLIRDTFKSNYQWTFLVGMNSDGKIHTRKGVNLHASDSEKGKIILDRLTTAGVAPVESPRQKMLF